MHDYDTSAASTTNPNDLFYGINHAARIFAFPSAADLRREAEEAVPSRPAQPVAGPRGLLEDAVQGGARLVRVRTITIGVQHVYKKNSPLSKKFTLSMANAFAFQTVIYFVL